MEITPEELKTKLDCGEKIILVDVRDQAEHAICHLKDARLIPLKELPNRTMDLNAEDCIILYCHHGMRSAQAALWLKRKGFSRVKSLQGGIDAWAETIDPLMKRY